MKFIFTLLLLPLISLSQERYFYDFNPFNGQFETETTDTLNLDWRGFFSVSKPQKDTTSFDFIKHYKTVKFEQTFNKTHNCLMSIEHRRDCCTGVSTLYHFHQDSIWYTIEISGFADKDSIVIRNLEINTSESYEYIYIQKKFQLSNMNSVGIFKILEELGKHRNEEYYKPTKKGIAIKKIHYKHINYFLYKAPIENFFWFRRETYYTKKEISEKRYQRLLKL